MSIPPPPTNAVLARNIHKTYAGRLVLQGVDIALNPGETVGILGPNGAGKTTCFYILTGLIPADNGSIWIEGRDVTTVPMYRRAHLGLGYLPQEDSVFRGLSVAENIYTVVELVEPNAGTHRKIVEDVLTLLGLSARRDDAATALSGGERRRLELARVLAMAPKYLLLDEPFAGIDPVAVDDIKAIIRGLKNAGIGILITDHNVRDCLSVVDRGYILHDGRVLVSGTSAEIVRSEVARKIYLGSVAEDFTLDGGRG